MTTMQCERDKVSDDCFDNVRYHHHNNNKALILLDASLMKRLQTTCRLPGTYIGVRRIRPSSRHVAQAIVAAKRNRKRSTKKFQPPRMAPVAYKIIDPTTGQERRMTGAEKKAAKQERARLYRLQLQQAKEEYEQEIANDNTNEINDDDKVDHQEQEAGEEEEEGEEADTNNESISDKSPPEASLETKVAETMADNDKFYYFKINPASVEQEVADLRGERSEVPPILLSAGQAHVALTNYLTPTLAENHTNEVTTAVSVANAHVPPIDDNHAQKWAAALRASMMPAIQTRRAEDMRAMVYDIMPQAWARLRPPTGSNISIPSETLEEPTPSSDRHTLLCTLRPNLPIDKDWNILMQALHGLKDIHIGCGAKFGCDILLYDGPRSERHSFAGLRLVRSTDSSFPLPRVYDLTGYVRCLNTAGKLALLATVVHDNEKGYRVSILDLALEKLDVKRNTKPTKTIEQRLENLAKSK